MKNLYKTLKTLYKTNFHKNPEFVMIKYPGFQTKLTLEETPPCTKKQLCYVDYYQLQQINLIKHIGINLTPTTTSDEKL